jgi:hypothetical protein
MSRPPAAGLAPPAFNLIFIEPDIAPEPHMRDAVGAGLGENPGLRDIEELGDAVGVEKGLHRLAWNTSGPRSRF